jgi:ribosomal subunit interface protein
VNFAIIGRNINLTESLLAHVECRVRAALSRFGKKVRSAAVQLTGTGPNSRLDKQCKVTAFLSRGEKLVVKEVGGDFYTMINRALERLERFIRLKIEPDPAQ